MHPLLIAAYQATMLAVLIFVYVYVRRWRFVPTILLMGQDESDTATLYCLLQSKGSSDNYSQTAVNVYTGPVALLNSTVKLIHVPLLLTDAVTHNTLDGVFLRHTMLVVYMVRPDRIEEAVSDVAALLQNTAIGCDIILDIDGEHMPTIRERLNAVMPEQPSPTAPQIKYVQRANRDDWKPLLAEIWKNA